MAGFNKVLWREGLFLTPQHFQAFDKRHEWLSWYYGMAGNPFNWGLYNLQIDVEAISNWQFNVRAIKAVMRDGSALNSPDTDSLPSPRSFEKLLTPDKQSLTVYLGLPREDPGRPGVRMSDHDTGEFVRFERRIEEVNDYVSGGKSREIEFVVKMPEIRFEGQPADRFDLLPIAKVELRGVGRPTLSNDFLPACLSMSASPVWTDVAASLFGQVNSLASSMCGQLTYGGDNTVHLTLADLPRFLQARELTAMVPTLLHYYKHPDSHPVGFYTALCDAVARLGVIFNQFSDNCADEFPPYDHENPVEGLKSLRDKLERMFSLVGQSREGELTLVPMPDRENMWTIDLTDAALQGNEEIYLWASCDLPEDDFLKGVIQDKEFRVAAPNRIDQLMTFALPGAALSKVANPPVMLPAPQKGFYFLVDTRDKLWQEIVDSKTVALMGRNDVFPNLQVRLHAIKP